MNGNGSEPMAINGNINQWESMAIIENNSTSMEINGIQHTSMGINGKYWESMQMIDNH